jgi:hypothetical protein
MWNCVCQKILIWTQTGNVMPVDDRWREHLLSAMESKTGDRLPFPLKNQLTPTVQLVYIRLHA